MTEQELIQKTIKALAWSSETLKWKHDQESIGDEETFGMKGQYSPELTEMMEVLEIWKSKGASK